MSDLRLISTLGIDRDGLLIDGKRLPFYLADEPIEVESSRLAGTKVTVTFIADAVEIDRSMVVKDDGEVQLIEVPPIEPWED